MKYRLDEVYEKSFEVVAKYKLFCDQTEAFKLYKKLSKVRDWKNRIVDFIEFLSDRPPPGAVGFVRNYLYVTAKNAELVNKFMKKLFKGFGDEV